MLLEKKHIEPLYKRLLDQPLNKIQKNLKFSYLGKKFEKSSHKRVVL